MLFLLSLFLSTANAQQMPTGPIQIVKDKKTVSITIDSLNPLNNVFMPITASSLPLPTGAATAANQATEIASLSSIDTTTQSIDGKMNSLGQKAMAGSMPIVIASDQTSIPVTGTFSNPSVGLTGAAVPASATLTGADKAGVLTSLALDAGNNLYVNVATSALPAGAATEAKQDTGNTSLNSIDTKITVVDTNNVSVTSSALPTNAAQETGGNLATIVSNQTNRTQKTQITNGAVDNTIRALNDQVIGTDYGLVVNSVIHGLSTGGGGGYVDVKVTPSGAVVSDVTGSTIAATQSGTWNINNISGTVSLPTGAATSANQTTANSSLSSIDGKLANDYGVATGALRTAAQVGNASGAADFGSGNSSAQTIRTVIASDQAALQVKAPINSTGSGSAAAATVSTVITLSHPSNAVGFVLMNLDTSTANLRWSIGRTATTTLGQQLQPGRDTGYIPCGADVSLVSESGTQNYDIQWVSQ